ncbi:chromate efflux transporter [Prosthecomicrobium hirschii]|uniref:chromate efflux transporter n=1 Tax=Prosthecodimorpha hirschii TaxID=665126 RepID=UPI0009F8C92C|nr:chromate efflux transporter [Prosthecomicrobium hirschii]
MTGASNRTGGAGPLDSGSGADPRRSAGPPSFGELVATFARIGCLSFGGPAGQIALMHRIVVDEKRWLDEKRYLDALNFCMLLPGPEAQQLATFCGWHLHRTAGALAAGLLFVLPGALLMLALAWAYAAFGRLAAVEALFYGVKAGVLAIVVEALIRVGRRALKAPPAWAIAAAAFAVLFLTAIPYPAVVVAAGLAGAAFLRGRQGPATRIEPGPIDWARAVRRTILVAAIGALAWGGPVLLAGLALGPDHVLVVVAGFFSKLAVVTFGGAYAVLAYMADAAVTSHGWLTPGEMLDGLGLAETTPGPLILVTQFVGFLAGWRHPAPFDAVSTGLLSAAMTTWVTFTPSILWILLGAPLVERIGRVPALSAALAGITAAVVGVILKLSLWFAFHILFREVTQIRHGWLALDLPVPLSLDPVAAVLALVAAYVLFRRHWSVAGTVGLTAALGFAARMAGVA